MEMYKKTLQSIDPDQVGQLRILKVLVVEQWITPVIKNPDDLLKGKTIFPSILLPRKKADYSGNRDCPNPCYCDRLFFVEI